MYELLIVLPFSVHLRKFNINLSLFIWCGVISYFLVLCHIFPFLSVCIFVYVHPSLVSITMSSSSSFNTHLATIHVVQDEEDLVGGGEGEVELHQVGMVKHFDQHRPLAQHVGRLVPSHDQLLV